MPAYASSIAASLLMLATTAPTVVAAPVDAADASTSSATHAPIPAGSMPLRMDASGRLQAQATLDGRGPLLLTVDTAATGTALSQAVAARLGLRAGADRQVVGGIGRADAQTVTVGRFHSDLFDLRNVPVLLLPQAQGDGILGMAPFAGGRIELDLRTPAMLYGPSGPTPEGFASVDGRVLHGILVVDIRIDEVTVQALVDTGAPYNVGNPALQAALGIVPGDPRLSPGGTFNDTFGRTRDVEQATLGRITLGGVSFARPTVRFADMPVFRALGLDDGPAMILGIGQLAQMGVIAIDFPRAQLQLRP